MDKFGEYMFYLLSTPFKQADKKKNQWYIFFKTVGELFDANKAAFQTARKESMVKTASVVMLPEHGADRGLSRYEGETWENYRIRIMMYAATCELGGTDVGTRQAVEALGFADVKTVPCYKIKGQEDRWAEFYVVITRDIDDPFDVDHNIIRKEVRRVKIASGKDNYMFVFVFPVFYEPLMFANPVITFRSWVNLYNNNLFNGLRYNNGQITHDNVVRNYPTCWRVRNQAKQQLTVSYKLTNYHNWRTNDGGSLNDGTKCFDACIIEEEI
jgi:hypothetical protein